MILIIIWIILLIVVIAHKLGQKHEYNKMKNTLQKEKDETKLDITYNYYNLNEWQK